MTVQLPVNNHVSQGIPSAGASKTSYIDHIPLPMVLTLAAPYLAGTTADESLKLAHKLYQRDHFTGTLDILGEDSQNPDDCRQAVSSYKALITAVKKFPLPVKKPRQQLTISFKPSMFSTVAPNQGSGARSQLDLAYQHIKEVVHFARDEGVNLTLEAEDHRWTDFQLETYFSLIKEGYHNLGTVLQSRLFRTRNDIKSFDQHMRVRLVIGIYNEPAEIAHTEKPAMKEVLIECAAGLLSQGTYVEIASHDSSCVENFFRQAVLPTHASPGQFETQFLLGVPRTKLQRALVSGSYFDHWTTQLSSTHKSFAEQLAHQGVLVRLYYPYGSAKVAGPYCKRRLKANPNMIGFGIRNLLHLE